MKTISNEAYNKLIAAIEFYAEPSNYYVQESPTHTIIDDDEGMRAQDALQAVQDEEIKQGIVVYG